MPLLSVPDDQLAVLLGLNRADDFGDAEQEHPDVLLAITLPATASQDSSAEAVVPGLCEEVVNGQWYGRANVLDPKHMYAWPVIDQVAEACAKTSVTGPKFAAPEALPGRMPSTSEDSAARLFRQRRSAQGFDGETLMQWGHFVRMLDALLPRAELAPWTGIPWSSRIHLVLFIHRVEGLKSGLYCLPRHKGAAEALKNAMRPEFLWQSVDDMPDHVPLQLLMAAKAERTAAQLSCQQPIAGTSCFSLGMIAEFEPEVSEQPWRYRELFWEAGAIGQVLYLEAEACFLRGTGIGCFYDDPVHQLLGLQDRRYQSLYHFTVGGALTDGRIASLPPYNR